MQTYYYTVPKTNNFLKNLLNTNPKDWELSIKFLDEFLKEWKNNPKYIDYKIGKQNSKNTESIDIPLQLEDIPLQLEDIPLQLEDIPPKDLSNDKFSPDQNINNSDLDIELKKLYLLNDSLTAYTYRDIMVNEFTSVLTNTIYERGRYLIVINIPDDADVNKTNNDLLTSASLFVLLTSAS